MEPYAKYTRGTKKSDGDVDDDFYDSGEEVEIDENGYV